MKYTLIISTFLIVIISVSLTSAKKPKKDKKEIEQPSELAQTPAEDRQWQARKKVTHVRNSHAKKIHIYLTKPKSKNKKQQNKAKDEEQNNDDAELEREIELATETQTKGTPELTTRSDSGKKISRDKADNVGGESKHIETHHEPEHHEHIEHVKEKTKIKHHHHHHHHNHVKTIIKKESYPVEKIVHVPVEKIVEKVIHVPKPYPVEKIVEKIIAVDKIVHVPKPYPVEKIVEKVIHVSKPQYIDRIVEKIVHVPVDKIVHVAKPYPVHVDRFVDRIVDRPVEKIVQVPVEKIVHVAKHIPYEKVVERVIHVPKPYPVIKHVHIPFEVKVPVEVERKVPYPVEVEKKVPVPYQVEKKVPYPVKIYVPQPYPVEKPIPVPIQVKVKDSHPPTYKHQENQLTAFDFDKDFGFSSSQKDLSLNYQQLKQPNYFSFQSSGYGSADNDDFARRTKPTDEKKKKKNQGKNKEKFASYYKTQEQHQHQEKEEQQQKEQLQIQQNQQQQQYNQLQQISHQLMQHSLPQLTSGASHQYSNSLYHVSPPPKHPESGQTSVLGSKLHTSFISKDSSLAASNSHEVMISPSGSSGYRQQPTGFQMNPQTQALEYSQQQQQPLNYVQPLEYQLGAAYNQQMFTMSPMVQQEQIQPTQHFTSYGMM